MDPVSTLSLMANIFGVITFAKDVVSVASQIRECGDSDQLLRLEEAAKSLQSAVADMNQSTTSAGPNATPADEDAGVLRIVNDITRTCQRVSKLLDNVHGGKGQPSKLSKSLQVFKTIWNRGITDQWTREISDAQQRLHLHATVSIKAKLEKHAMRLEDAIKALDQRTRDSLPSFLTNFGELSTKCDEILANQSRSEEVATSRHLEIIASLDVLRTRSTSSEDLVKQLNEEQIKNIEETILMSLFSPFMGDREEKIQEAHKKTCDWIFSNPSETGKPWDDFNAFLRHSQAETY